MNNLKKIGLIGSGAVGTAALAIGAAGVAGAQDEPTLDDPPATNESTDDGTARRDRRDERRQAMVDQLVEDGVISQDQVDDWQAVRDAIHAERQANRAEKLAGIAEVLGISVEDLQAAHGEGQSLADIAGDDLPALVEYLTAEATERIDAAVADGRITQEQADEKLDGLAERIEERIENGGGFGRRGHHHGGRFGRGPGGAGPSADAGGAEVVASLA